MKDLLDVIKLLKRFGIYIYTGNRRDDIDFMQSEVKDLYENGLIPREEYLIVILVLRSELSKMS